MSIVFCCYVNFIMRLFFMYLIRLLKCIQIQSWAECLHADFKNVGSVILKVVGSLTCCTCGIPITAEVDPSSALLYMGHHISII